MIIFSARFCAPRHVTHAADDAGAHLVGEVEELEAGHADHNGYATRFEHLELIEHCGAIDHELDAVRIEADG